MATVKYKQSYQKVSNVKAPAKYKETANAPAKYKNTEKAPVYANTEKAPAAYKIGTYDSQYADQLQSALNNVVNWQYDPLQDASYQALAKVYGARGNQAAKNSLADAAALNGGYGTSFAVSAAQQARNQYNQELAALVPDLEQTAYNRANTTLSALREADNTDYGRFRDTESDRQWKWSQDYGMYRDRVSDNQWKYQQDYNAYRDRVGDNQWAWTQRYNAYRDRVADNQWKYTQNYQRYQDALSQYQWALEYNDNLLAQKKSSSGGGGGGGGGRRSSGGGGGYSGGGGSVATNTGNSSGNTGARPGLDRSGYMDVALKTSSSNRSGGSNPVGTTTKRIKTNKDTIWWGGKAR